MRESKKGTKVIVIIETIDATILVFKNYQITQARF
jgi:hypothetical protein